MSSSNVEGYQPGEEVLGPVQLRIKGKLPARLLPKSPSTPPPHAAAAKASALATEADVEELSTSIVAVEEQQEALQDWYGSSDQDGSFPHLSGSGMWKRRWRVCGCWRVFTTCLSAAMC